MSTIEREIKILRPDGDTESIQVHYHGDRDPRLSLILTNGVRKEFRGEDLYDSFRLLRECFEKLNSKVLCNGARVDAYPSRMSRSMGGGRKIYILTMGKQARSVDLVDLFDYASPDHISTIQEQENYFDEWIGSLGK